MNQCISSVLTTAIAGLTAAAHAQSLTIEFRADRTTATVGETVRWSVHSSYVPTPDPTAAIAGYRGSFLAGDPAFGEVTDFSNGNLLGGTDDPPTDGATINGIDIYDGCVLHTCTARIGKPFVWFDVLVTDDTEPLWYDALGTASYLASDFIFEIPVEHCRDAVIPCLDHRGDPMPYFAVTTDLVNFRGCDISDLAEPFGTKDSADILAFVDLFARRAPFLDVAEPFGVHDLADVVGFVRRFAAGCP